MLYLSYISTTSCPEGWSITSCAVSIWDLVPTCYYRNKGEVENIDFFTLLRIQNRNHACSLPPHVQCHALADSATNYRLTDHYNER